MSSVEKDELQKGEHAVLELKKSFLILSGFPGIYDTVLLCTNRQLAFRHCTERPLLNKVI